jgi:hypothetical protein
MRRSDTIFVLSLVAIVVTEATIALISWDVRFLLNRYQSMSSGSIEHNMRNSKTSIRLVPSTAAAARQSAKRSIDALVIQFRIERMARRIGWTATTIFALVLMLLIPWINKPLIRLFS